jgi:hypothetical protein
VILTQGQEESKINPELAWTGCATSITPLNPLRNLENDLLSSAVIWKIFDESEGE